MDNCNFLTNYCFIATFSCFIIFSACRNPTPKTIDIPLDKAESLLDCIPETHALEDVIIEENVIFLKSKNVTMYPGQYRKEGDKILICFIPVNIRSENIALNCSTFKYNSSEFEILPNNSAFLYGHIIPPEEYELEGDILNVCADSDGDTEYKDESDENSFKSQGDNTGDSRNRIHILLGKLGSGISIVALIIYLLAFYNLSHLRNLPGYNLASLSIAFILAYSFHLIGQIPEVLGLSCIISGVLKLNFFLTAFFCMNVLAFDVWRTMKLATETLTVQSKDTRKKRFIWYSLYAWGCPLVISAFSVIFDFSDKIPETIKPKYGKDDVCDLTTYNAQIIFFTAPAFTLITINVFFFVRSFRMISSNKFKCTDDQNKQTVKSNFMLYLRLGIIMGMTWLIGVIGLISRNEIIWMISDLVNSLQGLFLFLLFACRSKVIKLLRKK